MVACVCVCGGEGVSEHEDMPEITHSAGDHLAILLHSNLVPLGSSYGKRWGGIALHYSVFISNVTSHKISFDGQSPGFIFYKALKHYLRKTYLKMEQGEYQQILGL